MLKVNQKLLLLCICFTLSLMACSQKQDISDIPMGQGDLDSNRKDGKYYTKLNANNNSHLPTGRTYEVFGKEYTTYSASNGFTEVGVASWYGPGFHGRLTANGEKYNQRGITAAHKLLPFDTMIRVTNLENGKSVVVRINDRGPFHDDRIIDLSEGAAAKIGMLKTGTAKVYLNVDGESSNFSNYGGNTKGVNLPSPGVNLSAPLTGVAVVGSGFYSSDPGEFGDDPSYYQGSKTENTAYLSSSQSTQNTAQATMYVQPSTVLPQTSSNQSIQGINPYGASSSVNPNQAGQTGINPYSKANPTALASSENSGINPYVKAGSVGVPNMIGMGIYTSAYGRGPSENTLSTVTTVPNTYNFSTNQGVATSPSTSDFMPDQGVTTNLIASDFITDQGVVNASNYTENIASFYGSYYLQLSVFDDKEKADELASSLRSQGFAIEVYADKDFYLVQSGPYETDNAAVIAKGKLTEDFPRAYFIIR